MDHEAIDRLVEKLDRPLKYIANALHHPDSSGGGLSDAHGMNVPDVATAIVTVANALDSIADSIDELAKAVSGRRV